MSGRRILKLLMAVAVPFAAFFAVPARAQAEQSSVSLSFTHLNIEDGLSQSTVVSVCQDADGYMWFSSNNGLNRYNGYDFTVYQHDDGDPCSLADNLVNKVLSGSDGKLWIGTDKSLSLWDPVMERFRNFEPEIGGGIFDIAEICPGRVLVITTGRHILSFDLETESFTKMHYERKALDPTCLYECGDVIYLGNFHRNVWRFDKRSGTFSPEKGLSAAMPTISILKKSETELWVGTEGDGMYILDTGSESCVRVRSSLDKVRTFAYDAEGRLWVGGRTGLEIHNPSDGSFSVVEINPLKFDGLSYESVKKIFCDNQGGMWIGTIFGGINYWHPLREKFRNVSTLSDQSPDANRIVSSLKPAPDGRIWVGTNSGGIRIFNPAEDAMEYTPEIEKASGFHKDDIKCFYFSKDGCKVYFGTHGSGMAVLDTRTKAIRRIPRPIDVYAMTDFHDGEILVGALAGLYAMDQDGNFRRLYPSTNAPFRIYTITQDSYGEFWAGGKDGLRVLSFNGEAGIVDSTPSGIQDLRQVICIHETKDGDMWIGTMDGLYIYRRDEGVMEKFTAGTVLGKTSTLAIEEEPGGRMWFSSDRGLCSYDPATGEEHWYSRKDGLTSQQYSNNASCVTESGEILFGSTNGITVINPGTIRTNRFAPTPIITELRTGGETVRPGDGTGILKGSISKTDHIRLKHYQNTISLVFTVPNYISGRNNSFAYRMAGVDKKWNYTSDLRSATYSNLDKGRYTFEVRAANNDGVWSGESAKLSIRVLPVWYRYTVVEILFCLLILASATFYIVQAFRKRAEENEQQIKNLNETHKKEYNRMRALAYTDKSSISESSEKFILKALDVIDANISDPGFNINELASKMCMCRSNLNIRIKEATGGSPLDLMRRYRFNEACRLLKEGELSIAEISDRTGFSSPSYFTTSFKKYIGCSPSEFQTRRK